MEPISAAEWLEKIGRKGGSSRSLAKRRAAVKNAVKARRAKLKKRLRKFNEVR